MPSPAYPFSKIPDLLKMVLLHDENVEINIAIEKNNGLTKKQGDAMMGVIRKVILQTIEPAAIVSTIETDLGLPEEKAKKLALDLLGKRFLAMEWYLGKIQPLIIELGGNVDQYLAEAKKIYPEVYSPYEVSKPEIQHASEVVSSPPTISSAILDNFDDRLTSFKGRAEILLRLTGLSSQIEEGMKNKTIPENDGQQLMQQLDAISYAVNTQDLNLFEVQSIKRRLTKVLDRVSELGQ